MSGTFETSGFVAQFKSVYNYNRNNVIFTFFNIVQTDSCLEVEVTVSFVSQ